MNKLFLFLAATTLAATPALAGNTNTLTDQRESLRKNLEIVSAIPANLDQVQGFEGEAAEFNPFAPDAQEQLEAFDQAYRSVTGESGRVESGAGMNPDSAYAELFAEAGGCYRESCPVFAYISRANQTLTLYLNGQAVDQWLVSTGMPGFGTPQMDRHVTNRVYTRYSSTKYPGGDYNGLGNMPYAVFIQGGFAIHGTPAGNWKYLGRPASHGCIRLHPSHAEAFNKLVRQNGPANVWVLVD